ncbi:uncharacterized protein SCHCODRAFT_02704675 [Schizophyllum commune H4-8]|uniref:uncharacterized protein n=1 Tax=Schizophyllum commune (strain H4-8 / FGSC 9210) TaxID=578458 RepID=UPI00215F7DC9|nr:uncharacterized protein SCHCODRAFT_02704675 [Schizophyllum commune H4-8]KAI5888759.1 hypothetical protein SCHCODRAFT_02704675 [Schizophyllum commune H4-8]
MTSHSPVRNHKRPTPQNPGVAFLQAHERSASPSVRDRQARSAKAQSIAHYARLPKPRRTALQSEPDDGRGPDHRRGTPVPVKSHPDPEATSHPATPLDQNGVPQPPPPQHSNSMPNSYGQAGNDCQHLQMTPGLEADIQRAHDMQQLAYGTAPATSFSFPRESYMKDPAVERLRTSERHNPRQGALSLEPHGHGGSHQGSPSSTKQPMMPPERCGSPAFVTPMSSPGEQSAAYRPEYLPNGLSTPSRHNTVTGAPVAETRPM